MTELMVPVSFGELIDKITILEIKASKVREPAKAANIRNELNLLTAIPLVVQSSSELGALKQQLRQINETLWEIEDRIRDCERNKDFGPTFIELARSVYRTNGRRAQIKRQINEFAGSTIVEEKSYRDYE
jgi:hypothetical protein